MRQNAKRKVSMNDLIVNGQKIQDKSDGEQESDQQLGQRRFDRILELYDLGLTPFPLSYYDPKTPHEMGRLPSPATHQRETTRLV